MQILYSFGLNDDGQCGVGSFDTVSYPYPVKFPYDKKIAQISSGSRHALILTTCGEVYSFGWGGVGQLGHGNIQTFSIPKKIEGFTEKIISISAGGLHSACIDANNHLYTWGSNTYGQLGFNNPPNSMGSQSYSVPNLVTLPSDDSYPSHKSSLPPTPFLVKEVSCGGMHTLAISLNGQLYAWGRSDCGQTGYTDWYLNKTPNLYVPTPVKTIRNIQLKPKSIKCSGFYSLILNEDGLVYAMGKEDYGCLGTCVTSSTNSIGVETPTLISSLRTVQIQQISALGWHSCFLDTEGRLYVTGKGEYGRLGLGDESSKMNPVQVVSVKTDDDRDTSAKTTVSSVTSPLSNLCTLTIPKQSSLDKILEVSAGGSHTIWRDENHQVFTTGRNDDGRCGTFQSKRNDRNILGMNITNKFFASENYKMTVSSVAAGGSNSFVLVNYETLKSETDCIESLRQKLFMDINNYYKNNKNK